MHEAGNKIVRDLEVMEQLVNEAGVEAVRLYEPMARHSTMRVGGPAQFWIEPSDFGQFSEAVQFCKARGIPVRVVGRGSNLLVRDGGIRGAVIHPAGGALSAISVSGQTITAGA